MTSLTPAAGAKRCAAPPVASRLGLGTVQFGMNYGITNTNGQVPEHIVGPILALAATNGIFDLDTAPAYGASEASLGRQRPPRLPWRITTKTAIAAPGTPWRELTANIEETFARSLAALRVDRVYGLLVHDVDILLSDCSSAVWDTMEKLKRSGRVGKIGASIYNGHELSCVLDRFPIDLVQLPFNAIDSRLKRDGLLSRLKTHGVEVHARSVFLQGLLLASPQAIPPGLGRVRSAVLAFQDACRQAGLSFVEGALGAVLRRGEIDRIIVGVTSVAELADIITAFQRALTAPPLPVENWALVSEPMLDPSNWTRAVS